MCECVCARAHVCMHTCVHVHVQNITLESVLFYCKFQGFNGDHASAITYEETVSVHRTGPSVTFVRLSASVKCVSL